MSRHLTAICAPASLSCVSTMAVCTYSVHDKLGQYRVRIRDSSSSSEQSSSGIRERQGQEQETKGRGDAHAVG
jgi:hypothetical protein